MNPYAAKAYKKNEVHTASQEEILILLYDGAIRFLKQARETDVKTNLEKFHNNVVKAQRIIVEFMSTLDMDLGGDVAKNLYQLYEYLHYTLVQANLKKDVSMIDEVLSHLVMLRQTWAEAIRLADKDHRHTLQDEAEQKVYSA